MKTKEFLCALYDRMRFYALTALQWLLCLLIAPALPVVVFIIWIDQIKND